jgi:hypothetical protein
VCHQSTDVRQADRAQSAETLLSPLSHVPLSAKNSSSIINSIVTLSPGTEGILWYWGGILCIYFRQVFECVENLKFLS